MALPSCLVRRDGGRYHVQIRLGKELASCLDSSHLRLSLRTSDGRIARGRLVDTLGWAMEFKDAPDLLEAGGVIVRKLEAMISAGRPTTKDLQARSIFEAYVTDFIRRAPEPDFAYIAKLPPFVHLFRSS